MHQQYAEHTFSDDKQHVGKYNGYVINVRIRDRFAKKSVDFNFQRWRRKFCQLNDKEIMTQASACATSFTAD